MILCKIIEIKFCDIVVCSHGIAQLPYTGLKKICAVGMNG